MDNENDQNLQRAFGKKIRELRIQRGMSQEQLSVHLNITMISIGHLERGIHPPAFNKLALLATAFGIEIWELFAEMPDGNETNA